MDEGRFSAWVARQPGELVIGRYGPVFYGTNGKRLDIDELRRCGVDLAVPEASPASDAVTRVRQLCDRLERMGVRVRLAPDASRVRRSAPSRSADASRAGRHGGVRRP